MNDFKSTDSLFAKIKEDFNNYDAASLIDDGMFHKEVKYILNRLGLMWFREAEEVLDVCNHKVALPSDFHLVEAIFRCNCHDIVENLQDGMVLKKLTFDHYPDVCDRDPHNFSCADSYNPPCIFNRQEEILIQRTGHVVRYGKPVLMKPGDVNTKRNCCTKTCNFKSDCIDSYVIQNGYLNVNFREGAVYMMYNAFPLDEDGYPLIPVNEIVEKALEYHLKTKILEYIWVNGEADVEKKLSYFKNEAHILMGDALYETKLPSFENMIKQIRLRRKNLSVYQID